MRTNPAHTARQCAIAALLGLLFSCRALALPGDILFADNFERGGIAPWVASNSSRAGIVAGPDVAGSPTRGAYTRRGSVTVTSPAIAAAVPAAELTIWVRRGSDVFSDYPEAGRDLELQVSRADGSWITLTTYPGGGLTGEIFTDRFALPPNALHANLAVRLRQTGNGKANENWWHFDDLRVVEALPPAPLAVGVCDDFENGLSGNWVTASGGGSATTSGAAYQSPFTALELSGGSVTVSSDAIDTTDPLFSTLSLWVQRGSDAFSEKPDNNEDLVVEYLADSGSWVVLETFRGNGKPGGAYLRDYPIAADGRHAAFRVRLRQTGGSGPGEDYWHIDDLCLNRDILPALQVTKVVETINDPVNGSSNPKAIPGALMRYTIEVSNQGPGAIDAGSLELADAVPQGTVLLVDAGAADPVRFADGPVASGLAYDFANHVYFSNQAGGGPPYDYVPVADADGFDPAVTGLAVRPAGVLAAAAGGAAPSFTIQLFVRVR